MNTQFKGTPGPWIRGKWCNAVVAVNSPEGFVMGRSEIRDLDYYGGFLIAESIEDKNIPLIAAAPDLLLASIEMIEAIDNLILTPTPLLEAAYRNMKKSITKALQEP